METLKRRYAQFAVSHTDHNKKRAAELLDVGRRTLYRYLDSE